jgi:nicotinate phosphoribosyltransferase
MRTAKPGKPDRRLDALLTDLYELTMAQAYFNRGMVAPATFSLFIREYPPRRGYFVSAGLEHAVDFLENFRFSREALDFLQSLELFSTDFLNHLEHLHFSGEVVAIPEGRIFFKDEPVLEVTAPVIEAQLVESFLINAVNFPTLIATKAARCYYAARGRGLVDFSLRRTPGEDAGLNVARASYLAGFDGTSNVLAGKLYDIPVSGTMAHSFVMSFEDETEAFRAFARTFGDATVLLVDTYDTLSGTEKAIRVAREMQGSGGRIRGLRLDSGNMTALSKSVREKLDQAGFNGVKIFASGGFDEYKIDRSLIDGAHIDAFGVGTKMGVSADDPYLDIAYKLVRYDRRPVLKLSTGKQTLVDEKQVFRYYRAGAMHHDRIGLRGEDDDGEPLLITCMQDGRRKQPAESLGDIRSRFLYEFGSLPNRYKDLKNPDNYPVEISEKLGQRQHSAEHRAKAQIVAGSDRGRHNPSDP